MYTISLSLYSFLYCLYNVLCMQCQLWIIFIDSVSVLKVLCYCMVCAYVREDNPQALLSGLSPIHMHNHTITFLLHQHACALCTMYVVRYLM